MNKEELLQKTCDEVAKKEYGCRNWTTLYRKYIEEKPDLIIIAMEIAMQRYAVAMCEEQKKHDSSECKKLESHYYDDEGYIREVAPIVLQTKNVAE